MATTKTNTSRQKKPEASRPNLSNGKSASSTTNGSSGSKKSSKAIAFDQAADKKALTLKAFAAAYEAHHRKAT